MSFTRRSMLIFLAGLLSGSLSAQTDDPIANWTAPPFWMPPKAEVSKSLEPGIGRMAPEAVEGGPAGPLAFTAITPCRIVDTRGNGFTGAYGPPSMAQGAPRDFALAGRCGIPAGSFARAISLNITVTNTQGPGFILIYPKDAPQPNVSTLNYVAGQTVANAAVVQLNADVATVLKDQTIRDEQDRSREHSPLEPAVDSVEVDTTGVSIDEVVARIAALAAERR